MVTKEKATLDTIWKELEPYLHRHLFKATYINAQDVSPICQRIRRKYSNVEIAPHPGANGKPYLNIKVKGFLKGGNLSYEIKVKGKSVRTHDPLSWIDRMEDFDAFMN